MKQKEHNEIECQHVEYDDRQEGYCKASLNGGPINCPFADYLGKSLYPPCTKHWFMGVDENSNVDNYNRNFRGK